ncbi:OmpA family protein [Arcobacter sp. YIC-80]|uniref:OmpA family protein n=1 Tax=Arcobacter sp. YIC-80 TaxID=3376683 RepID=UPI00384EF8A8
MSLGTKIFSLLIILIVFIFYTVISFDYSKVEDKYSKSLLNSDELFMNFNTQSISKYIENMKIKALKIKDDLLKDASNKEVIEEVITNKPINIEEEIIVDEQAIQKELTKDNKEEETTDFTSSQEESINQEEIQEQIEETKEKEEIEEIEEKPTPEQLQIQINDILKQNKIVFKRRSVDITKESTLSVEKIATLLMENENIKVEIAGHTDSRGRASLNQRISQNRANSVKDKLIALGVNKDRLKAVGYGEKFPIAKDDKNGLSEINRRVEINIIGEN